MRPVPIAAALAALLLTIADPSVAQDVAVEAKPAQAKPPQKMTDVTLGVAYGGPTEFTGSLTVMRGVPRMLVAFSPGKLVQVRAGNRGGQIGLGLVAGVFEESLVKPNGLAVTLKAIAIRSWGDPTGVTDGHTYAGIESDVVLLGLRGSIGYAWKVSGTGGPGGRLVWSVGLGL